MHFARDDERKTESQSETEALLADADALARVWSFCLGDGSQTIAQCILTFLAAPFRSVTRWASIHEERRTAPSFETTRAPVTSRGVSPRRRFGTRLYEGWRRQAGMLELSRHGAHVVLLFRH
jgi:predicted deacetylase